MSAPIELPELKIPPDLPPSQMPDLLRYWYLGTRARRHMMLRRFAQVDAKIADILEDRTGNRARPRVLDIGSAWGFNVMALERLGWRATGLDLVVDQFEFGARIADHNGVAFEVLGADAAGLPFADGSFDAVTMVETFEHVYIEDRPRVLDECRRVLRGGGRLVMSTPSYSGLVERFKRFTGNHRWLRAKLPTMCYPEEGTTRQDYHPYNYHHPLPEGDIRALLEDAGFRLDSTTHFLFMLKNTPNWLFPAVAAVERAFEAAPGFRRLAATTCFTADRR